MSERYRHYTDGEYEYRIERCEDDSGVHAMEQTDLRAWKLADRPIAPPRIVMTNFCTHEPQCIDDGAGRVSGQAVPPANPWEPGVTAYLPNAAGWDAAERRLLGAELLAACERTDGEAAAAKRMQASATDAPVAVRVDLGRSYLRDTDR